MTRYRGQRALFQPDPHPERESRVNHGAVFTRPWVADFILDMAGYDPAKNLGECLLVDPACGDGAFLVPAVERLIASRKGSGDSLSLPSTAIRAYDLQWNHVVTARSRIQVLLQQAGISDKKSTDLAETWINQADFLLEEHDEESVDFVVGNPPYIRLEEVPTNRMAAYRAACTTMNGRADIYLGFFEIGLRLLAKNGTLAFICADRWMRNAYGRHLRAMVADGTYAIEAVVEMHDVDAFERNVSAYPAVTVLRRADQGSAVVVRASKDFEKASAQKIVQWTTTRETSRRLADGTIATRLPGWFETGESWPSGSPERLALLRQMETTFLPLQTSHTRVGIGVATGADRAFVVDECTDIERDRLIPLVTTRDIADGTLRWSGRYLVNPWARKNELVPLDQYPGLHAHFAAHEPLLRRRHVAAKDSRRWYRTIDPVHTSLTSTPKLLVPDMKLHLHPVLDKGGHYPHHNLYYIVSDEWDLRVLGGLLLSRVAQFFVESYAVRMRGGTLRFQAQYLRRIRLPRPAALSRRHARGFARAFDDRDARTATALALEVYGIDHLPD